ncbi:Wzz/FepE/Etk N-terminal domain-containing protein [Marinospirillum sp.]|uniref:Wzz/FepE/Etk N-terminal domain-containing protein n=1 Tax=Marinospirillum sp. TaxID=2183934 RepID=UPI00287043F5|nr:Wzz/FepE/Etk N-terminal domain-containing protein [Marinospirillum sp.]MDR9469428.1 Wzz/FepE/Etk N-terminal domain-containing protein [Marinospirillum sp.]
MTTSQEPSNQPGVPATRDAQFQHYPDDEISLIDLAKILIKRRWWVMGVGGIVILLALVFALIKPDSYQLVTVYQMAEKEPGDSLRPASQLIEQAQSLYWPEVRRNYLQNNNLESMPFELEITNPEKTVLITLVTKASKKEQPEVVQLHSKVLDRLKAYDHKMLESYREQQERQKTNVENLLELASSSSAEKATELVASYTDRLFNIEDSLARLSAPEIVQTALATEKSNTLSSKLILALGVVLGGIMGVMAAFIVEFAARVRQSLKEEER